MSIGGHKLKGIETAYFGDIFAWIRVRPAFPECSGVQLEQGTIRCREVNVPLQFCIRLRVVCEAQDRVV